MNFGNVLPFEGLCERVCWRKNLANKRVSIGGHLFTLMWAVKKKFYRVKRLEIFVRFSLNCNCQRASFKKEFQLNILQILLDPILPVFAIMAFGFILGRTGKADVADARLLNRFTMSVLLPIFIFGLIAQAPIHDFNIGPVLVYVCVEAIVFAAGFLLALRVFKRPTGEALLLGFCGIFANNALYILPISVLLYGEESVLPISAIITLDATVAFGGSMIALQLINLGKTTLPDILLGIAKTPMLQAIVLAIIVSATGLTIAAPVQTFINFAGAGAAPVALYALGVVLSKTRFQVDAAVFTFVGIKLLVFPAAIWAGLEIFAANDVGRNLFLLGSAGPSGAMAFSLAMLYNIRIDAIAQIIIWTSILTLFSLAFLAQG